MPLEGSQIVSIVVSAVALVVSTTALIWSTLQLIHSYLGSAKGYSKVNEEVMPGWVKFKQRVYLKDQFRFGVKYDTPVFIVCSVKNDKFPMPRQTPLFIGDSRPDEEKSNPGQDDVRRTKKGGKGEKVDLIPPESDPKNGLHTINNERATWITLLRALHSMETQSRQWEMDQHKRCGPNCPEPPPFESSKLAVAIQRKTRSWDNMPSGITKPYATTTICHMTEMAAMLGLHWKEFDRASDNFLAEGNGYVLKSTSVSELGTVFTFQVRGSSIFERNRVIPAEEVKDLAFGLVPTIYHENSNVDGSRLTALPADELKDLKYLQMGSANELAETFVSLGCNTEISELIRRNDTTQRHLYPLAFEVVGMLSKALHIKNSFFRALPNPTFYQWDVRYFNMSKLLLAFGDKIADHGGLSLSHISEPFRKLENGAKEVRLALSKKSDEEREPNTGYADYLNSLHKALRICDENLMPAQTDVRKILARHIQIVLLLLNSRNLDATTKHGEEAEPEGVSAFNKLNSAPEGDKEKQLIDIYFKHVLPEIRGGDESIPGFETNTDMWCTLVFRSLCWLSLHDFHKNDKQPKGKSELMGSRVPVYII